MLEVGSRWQSAELLSCHGLERDGRSWVREGKGRAQGLAVLLLHRAVAGKGAAERDPAGMQGPVWF